MTEVDTGTVLAGKYRLESLIGRGGMGSVWRAEHLGLSAPVAVKLLDLVGFTLTTEALQRFHREARAAANIRSPHVVQILDHGVDQTLGVPFIVMELMEGESLAQRLARSGRISAAEVAHVFNHVARALVRAHEAGIVHRDLKPDNVFLVRNEDEIVAKVLDFGIAKGQAHGLGHDSATRTGAVMGTAYYMSPEQISGDKNVDLRTDLWAFGVMACECLTGRRPFDAPSIGGLTLKICVEPIPVPSSFAAVPAGFDAWFLRIVNRDPAQRFASVREAADALRAVLTGDVGGQRSVAAASASAEPTHVVQATTLTTSVPVSSNGVPAGVPAKTKGSVIWIVGAVVVAALGCVLWLRHGRGNDDVAATPLAGASSAKEVAVEAAARVPGIPTQAPEAESSTTPNALPSVSVAAPSATPSPFAEPTRLRPQAAKPKPPPIASPQVPAGSKLPAATPKSAGHARDVIDDRH
jgi:eukaryotic-like serine/threonine-protein kinase